MIYPNFLLRLYFKAKKRYTYLEFEEIVKNIKIEKEPPKPKMKYRYENKIFYFNEESNNDLLILYIHGGAYVNSFDKYHFKFINKLIKKTNALVIAPNYGLVPLSNAEKIHNEIIEIYKMILDKYKNKKIIVMGDSAGGGISLSLAIYLRLNNIKYPNKLILISPCVDITLTNPLIPIYAKKDPWLYLDRLNVCAKYFADNLDYKDYRVSPTYGDLSNISDVLIFVGTKDILYPDIDSLFNKIKDNNNRIVVKKNMLHVYPILPILEAKNALKEIINYIKA